MPASISTHPLTDDGPASWKATLAGALPFATFGLLMWGGQWLRQLVFPYPETPPDWATSIFTLLFLLGFFIIPLTGLVIGWIAGFPRWSYPYTAMSLLFSLYISNASTPGLALFGYPIFNREVWGWRAFIPLLLALAVSLVFTRSMASLGRFFSNIWRDWTRLTYTLFGTMPLLVWIFFDETEDSYEMPFQIFLMVVMLLTSVVYLRSRHAWQRVAALLVGSLICLGVGIIAPAVFWAKGGPLGLPDEARTILTLMAILFAPAIIGLLHRVTHVGPPAASPGGSAAG
jgi:hypothetical protein